MPTSSNRDRRKLHNDKLCYLFPSPNQRSSHQIKKNEMGRACDPYGEEYCCIQGFGETDHLEHLCIARGRGVILKWIFKEQDGGVEWICLSTGVSGGLLKML